MKGSDLLLIAAELQRTKFEFARLHEIGRYINSNMDNSDFLTAVSVKLKSLFDFDDQFLAVPSDDNLYLNILRYHHPFDPLRRSGAGEPTLPVNDALISKSLFSEQPVITDLDFLVSRNLLPGYLLLYYGNGVRKTVMVSLQVSGRILGLWVICFKDGQPVEGPQLQFIRTVASYLEFALAHLESEKRRNFQYTN
ncbi:MAG: hypothetical protein ABWY16_21155 [Pedobacter sp.]|uniref:hypothetical protein n=1 Tax=Pedobacter sp. TaxID=1411316 RepID=UPI003398AB67